ncbi:hypothetical protein MKX03_010111, partial [Papaver bracteatum]
MDVCKPQEKQAEYLSSLLIPLCNQVQELLLNANVQNQEESYAKIANIQQLIIEINASPFHVCSLVDVLLQILVVFPKFPSSMDIFGLNVPGFLHLIDENLVGCSILFSFQYIGPTFVVMCFIKSKLFHLPLQFRNGALTDFYSLLLVWNQF